METTARAKLPLLAPGQTQKEAFHNEALLLVDALLGGVLVSPQSTAPPAMPDVGLVYDIPANATGEWSGKDGLMAVFTGGGWRFMAPFEGLRLTEGGSGLERRWANGAWESGIIRGGEVLIDGQKVLGERAAAIAAPSGGTTLDIEARNCLLKILQTLREHGLIET